jgi:hypothetical protein
MKRHVVTGLLLLTFACHGGDRQPVDAGVPVDAGPPGPVPPHDAGAPNHDAGAPNRDAGALPGDEDASAPSDGGGIGDWLTCKPEELNPLVECLTVICPMKADIISQSTCLVTECVKQYEAISEKCRECVTAAIGQDVLAIVQSCVDTGAVLGDGGIALPF